MTTEKLVPLEHWSKVHFEEAIVYVLASLLSLILFLYMDTEFDMNGQEVGLNYTQVILAYTGGCALLLAVLIIY